MTQAQAQRIIGEMVERIINRFDAEKVILFGSYAKGEATKDSDVDLIVVLPRINGRRLDQCVRISMAVSGMGLAKDIIVRTPEEMAAEREIPGTIGRIAHLEGKVLYERPH